MTTDPILDPILARLHTLRSALHAVKSLIANGKPLQAWEAANKALQADDAAHLKAIADLNKRIDDGILGILKDWGRPNP